MKFRRLLVLLVVLASCMIFAAQAFAAIGINPGDIIGTLPPLCILDPCCGAALKTDMGDLTIVDISDGANYRTEVLAYDLLVSGSPVVHMITTYKRVTVGGVDRVSMEDTFIDPAGNGTIFGHSVNRNQGGIIGIQGVFTGAVNGTGTVSADVKGSYLTTNSGGTNRMCLFLQ